MTPSGDSQLREADMQEHGNSIRGFSIEVHKASGALASSGANRRNASGPRKVTPQRICEGWRPADTPTWRPGKCASQHRPAKGAGAQHPTVPGAQASVQGCRYEDPVLRQWLTVEAVPAVPLTPPQTGAQPRQPLLPILCV